MLLEKRVANVDLHHLKGYLGLDDLFVLLKDLVDVFEDVIGRMIDECFRNVLDHEGELRSREPI
jgi:hypothetical protein